MAFKTLQITSIKRTSSSLEQIEIMCINPFVMSISTIQLTRGRQPYQHIPYGSCKLKTSSWWKSLSNSSYMTFKQVQSSSIT
jgi:hypothetical protein